MKRLALCTAIALVSLWTGLWTGCDTSAPEDPIPTIERVQLLVSPTNANHTFQSFSAWRIEKDSFEAGGRLVLEPGKYEVDIRAYNDAGKSVTSYLSGGPGEPLLRYKIGNDLAGRVSLREVVHPHLAPLDSLAPKKYFPPPPKTSPVPPPRFRLIVADTSSALGTIRLVYEHYERTAAYREGQEPTRIDFDLRVRLRTVPSLDDAEPLAAQP